MNNKSIRFNWLLAAFLVLVLATTACGSSAPASAPQVSTATSVAGAVQAPADTPEGAASDDTLAPTNTPIPVATETPKPTDTPVPTATNTPVPELYLGDSVSEFGYTLTGVSVIDPAPPGKIYTPKSGKKLIAVELVLSNQSGDMLNINPLYATLLDSDGFTYQTELMGVESQLPALGLNQGERVKGLIAFEVPENAVPDSIKYALDPFGAATIKADLTPPPADHVAVPELPFKSAGPFPKLGDVVENFGYSLSAVSVEDPAKPGILYTPREGYRLVAVEIVLGNVSGSEPLSANPMNAFLVDSDGFVYSTEITGREDQMGASDLATGEKVKGWVEFIIPDGASPASIKYSTQVLSNNYLQTGVSQ